MPVHNKRSRAYSEEFFILDDIIDSSQLSLNQYEKKSEIIETITEKEPVHVLPRLMAMAFACILDETTKKLDVILNFEGVPIIKEEAEEVTEGEEVIFDHKTLKTLEEMLEYEKMVKFQKDVNFVKKILEETTTSLLKANCFDHLMDEISEYKQQREARKELLKELKQYKQDIVDFKKKSEEENRTAVANFQNLKKETMKIGDEVMEHTILKHIKMRYVAQWENSRHELNTTVLKNGENKLRNVIHTTETEIERENAVHNEIERFINEQQKDYEEQIDEWIHRYDTEMEQLDLDISVTNEKIEDQEKKNADIKRQFEERTKFIEGWLAYREQKRLERERYERIFEAAMTIQNWWRTVMIRKKLGPYGKKKGKGKGKKK